MITTKYWEKDCLELDGILTFDSNNFKCSIKNYSVDEYVLELKEFDYIGLELRLMILKLLPLNIVRETVFEILKEYEKEPER